MSKRFEFSQWSSTALSLTLLASVSSHASTVVIQGANGANGAAGGNALAIASGSFDSTNSATGIGGNGGAGGNGGDAERRLADH